jgi:hypothetical protein
MLLVCGKLVPGMGRAYLALPPGNSTKKQPLLTPYVKVRACLVTAPEHTYLPFRCPVERLLKHVHCPLATASERIHHALATVPEHAGESFSTDPQSLAIAYQHMDIQYPLKIVQ